MTIENKLITPENKLQVAILSSLVVIILLILFTSLAFNDLINKIELKSFDWRSQLSASVNKKDTSKVVILAVDDISLQKAVSNPELGLSRWPWPRSVHGSLVKFLTNAGAKAIVFDIVFEGSEGHSEQSNISDAYFVDAVKQTNNVFLASSFTYSSLALDKHKDNRKQIEYTLINTSSPLLRKLIKRFALDSSNIKITEYILKNIQFYNVSSVLPGLLMNARAIGSVTLPPSKDGIIRRVRPIVYYDNNYYPSLPLAVYLALNPDKKLKINNEKMQIGKRIYKLNPDGSRYINWYGPASTFKHYRAFDIYISQKVIESGKPSPKDPNLFKDKIVIVGLTAAATDILPTPMSAAYPGPEVIATSINNYISGNNFINKLPFIITIIITISLCLLAGSFVFSLRSGVLSIFLSLVIAALYNCICVYYFIYQYLWIDMIYPSVVVIFTIMITFVAKYVTTRKAYEDTYLLATTDGLTGLYNHRYFQENISVLLQRAQRYDQKHSMVLIDIDFFKKVNDTYGHRAGDAVLKEVAERLQDAVRATDITARYGGEEMAVLLVNTAYENALNVAEKLRNAIDSKEFVLNSEVSIHVTVSVGVAEFPRHAKTPHELIEIADQGLYYAKEHGRNQVGTLEIIQEDKITNKENIDQKVDSVDILLTLDQDKYLKLIEKLNVNGKSDIINWIYGIIEDLSSKE